MSNFPTSLDDDVTLPRVDDNITEIGGEAINALRDAVFNIEEEIGVIADGYSAKGSKSSIAARLGVSLEHDGTIKPSAIASLGLVTLPITNSQISATAAIAESKLNLAYSTSTLYNYINNFNTDLNTALNFITNTGSKIEPHLQGNTYRHRLSHIDIGGSSEFFKSKTGGLRDNTNLYTLFNDVNKDFVSHQKADGTTLAADPTSPSTGIIPPANYAHVAAGIRINTSNFSFIPQTAVDLQQFAQFIDNSNIFILGTRIQTLYDNGIPRTSRSASLTSSDSGQNIIPYTLSTTYLLEGGSSIPVENIDTGDDIISITPTSGLLDNSFDAKFAQVKVGDIATVNYGSVIVSFIIKERKFIVSGPNKTFIIRINGKNLFASTTAQVKIDRPLFNTDKQGVLALAVAPLPTLITGAYPSLTVGNPRGAQVIGVGFNPDLIDSTRYKLYLQFFPTGNPADSVVTLAPIDITGNAGETPGLYTLDSIVESLNTQFRKPGFNYRFIAFAYKGELGLMLADSFNNASFSIISGVVNSAGAYDQSLTATLYPNNVIGLFDNKDALGFGPSGANVASPAYSTAYVSSDAAQVPTKIFMPLTKKTYYVNGVERERLNLEPNQLTDGYGDGYWPATIVAKQIIPGTRVKVTYQVNKDLTTSGLKVGKTLVVQSEGSGTVVDFGRFVIEDVQFNDCVCDGYTAYATITVYDAIHSTGNTPYLSSAIGTKVRLYFSSDSVSFSTQNANDAASFSDYKRWFEVFVNQDGQTFTYERARMNVTGSTQTVNGVALYSASELSFANLYRVSPKLRGYSFSSIKKINLTLTSYDVESGTFSGYLCKWNGSTETNLGPVTVGKKGNVVRFYDESVIDYIDIIFNPNDAVPAVNSTKRMDIQLFPSLSLDDEVMLLGTCQVTDSTKKISYLKDERQFGNVSETQLSTSALDYIAAPTQLLNENGIIRGFDIVSIPTGSAPYSNVVSVKGGTAIVNGRVIHVNNSNIAIPVVQETLYPAFTTNINTISWFLCVNDKAELQLIANTDFDTATSTLTYDAASLDHTRVFYVRNPNVLSSSPYVIRGHYLNEIITSNKDITPIAIITTTISVVSSAYVITSASYSDMRRFVGNGFGGQDNMFILGNNSSFRSFESLNAWLSQLTKYKSATLENSDLGKTVKVKGDFTVSNTVSLDYPSKIVFKGDHGVFNVTTATGFAVSNNVEFEGLKFNYKFDATGNGSFTDANLANFNQACIKMTVASSVPVRNFAIRDCIFTTSFDKRFPFFSCIIPGENYTVENLVIKNNRFESTATPDDKDAVITIVSTNTTAPTSAIGSRLTNCIIDGNICNKNQMIMLSATYGTSIVDAIVPVNVKITNNICGAINYCVKQDIPLNTVNTTAIKDKDNGLVIQGNTCRYIFVGNNTGFINQNATTNRMVSKKGFYSGSTIIKDNVASWIHVGYKIPTGYVRPSPTLLISGNKLTAYLTTFLDSYWSGISGLNYALIVDKTEV